MTKSLTRRGLLLAAAAALPGMASATDIYDIDPADEVPRWFSVQHFLSLDENQIYKVNLAIKRGRPIRIGNYSRSESRKIIKAARENPEAVRAQLSRAAGSGS